MAFTLIKHYHFLNHPQKDNLDMRNIDPEFVREAIPNSVIKSQGMGASSLGDNVFQGFSYAPVHNHNLGY